MQKEETPACCDEVNVHEDAVTAVRAVMPDPALLGRLADLYRVFGDGTRLRLLYLLSCRELCVCDLAALSGVSLSAVSHQLRTLKQMRLVIGRREGKAVFYSLSDDHVRTILSMGMEHIRETEIR